MRTKKRDDRMVNQHKDADRTLSALERFLYVHYKHTAERLRSRYGIELSYDAWEALNQRLYDEREVSFLFKPNTITAVYRLKLMDQDIGVMFSTRNFCVTTVIPPEDVRMGLVKPIPKLNSSSLAGASGDASSP